MRISIFGLGYVGCVSAACFAMNGHDVIGVDINPLKVDMINSGKSPIIEPEMDKSISESVKRGKLFATLSTDEAILKSDVSLVCVGTPSLEGGGPNLQFIQKVSRDIGNALSNKKDYHIVTIRSTIPPGTIEGEVIPLLETASGRKAGAGFGVCSNPEFLREGSAFNDFYAPAFTLIGELDSRSGDQLANVYSGVNAPLVRTEIRTAEMIKYVSNAFHALKITFANEIGVLCKSLNIDSHKVMNIFALDDKLNISKTYLKPGYAFGGSCLPKDLRTLQYIARHQDMDLPLLQSIMQSNDRQAQRGVDMVLKTNKKNIGIIGLSFKPGTDDLRESPMVYLIETLLGKGCQIKIYDENVSLARLMGANKSYIEHVIPHITSLLSNSIEEVINSSEVLVIGHHSPAFIDLVSQRDGQTVIDLVRLVDDPRSFGQEYDGICW
jgi:GDP-mannose 6-dehydrogenase